MKTIKELEQKIREANIAYRTGESIITDEQYDTLLEDLTKIDPLNQLLIKIGIDISSIRKEKLPIILSSINKVKTMEELKRWMRLKNIPGNTPFVLTPKFDGISLCVEECKESAWSRGNGVEGQRSDEHLKLISRNKITDQKEVFTYGELIMKRSTFLKKYSEEFSNPRNLVAGQINHKTPNEILRDCNYISYGIHGMKFESKEEELNFLNENQKHKVQFKVVTTKNLTEDFIKSLFTQWSEEYEIDGIIIEVNDIQLREKLGRETSTNNPCYVRAYKSDTFEEVKESKVIKVNWHISKKGLLKPVIEIEEVNLDGANVKNVTGNNAKFIKDMKIGIGTIIKVKRSGMVIPLVVEVVHPTGFELPHLNIEIGWSENGVELVALEITKEQRLKQIISFFEILEIDNLGEGNIKAFFENGYDTVKKILQMSKADMNKIDRFGERKSDIIYENIHSKTKNISLSKLQHSSNCFQNLGSKKLLLLEDLDENATISEIINREGFSEISAQNYLDGILKYKEFEKDLEGLVTIEKTEEKQSSSNELDGMVFVFTGIRRRDLEQIIEEKGGKISSGVSKNSTHLVMKVKGSGSSKEKKALNFGQTILTVEELEEILN